MNIQRKTSNIANIVVYDASGNIVLPAGLTVTGLNTAGYVKTNASGVFSISATVTGSDITGAALTKTDDTNVTLTLGGNHATSLLRAASLALGWVGQLAVSRGGTGLSALGTANQLIRVNAGATALEYFTPVFLTANQSISFAPTGDVTGTASGTTTLAPALTLATITQSTGSSFVKITLDTKGRVTGNTAVASGDITSALGYTPYNSTNPSGYTSNTGTVISVAALTIGTTGTDITSSVANGTTSAVITLNVPTASAANRGALSSADWSIFNGKQSALNGTGLVRMSGVTVSYITGTSSQFVKADGTLDSNTYALSSALSGYLPLAGGTLTGALGGVNATFSSSVSASNFHDAAGSYNVNLGSGGSEGRGLVAGYSGSAYSGIGYNVRHTTTAAQYIAPGTDTSSYILFTAGGFTFYGAPIGTAGRTLSYSTLGSFNSAGLFNAVNITVNGSQVWHAGNLTNLNQLTNGPGYITSSSLGGYLPLAGGTLTGGLAGTSATFSSLVTSKGLANRDNIGGNALVLPSGGSYYAGAASNTGAIAITLPKGMGNAMIRMTIKIYQYTTSNSFEVNCGGYMYNTGNTWVNNPFAYIVAQPGCNQNWTVRFGYTEAGKGVIYIGETTSTWSYLGIHVTDVQISYSDSDMSTWNSGWTIGYATSFENVTATQTNTQVGMFLDGYARNQSGGANTIVQRDASGYIYNSYFNTSSGGSERNASGMGYFAGFNSGDYFIRSYTPAAVAAALGLGSMAYASTSTYYLASNPSGYISSYTETDTLASVTGRGASTTTAVTLSSSNNYYNGHHYFIAFDSAGNHYPHYNTGSDNTGSIVNMRVYGASGTMKVFLLNGKNGAISWDGNTILHSANWNSYAPSLTGTGASGTWGISISGNAVSANTATSATTAGLISVDNAVVYGRSGLQFAQSPGPAGNTANEHQTPDGNWWHILRMNHANSAGYYTDLAVSMTTNTGLLRRVISSGAQLSNWVAILDSLNYNSYSPTLTGGGASGTWAINVTGSAGSVAWANVTSKPTEIFNYDGWVDSPGYNANTIAGNKSGFTYSNNAPYTGPIAHFAASNYGLQFNATYSGNGTLLAYRTKNGDTAAWNSWHRILNSAQDPYADAMNQYVRTSDSPTFAGVYVNGWFRNNAVNIGLYSEATTQHWSSSVNGYWDASSTTTVSGIRFFTGSHMGTIRGYVYADNANNIGFLNSVGDWSLRCDNSGNVTATGDVTAYSDARVKTNIETIENALEKVTSLRGVKYNRTDTDDKSEKIGVIAQEIQEVIPQVVNQNNEGMLGVSYGNLAGVFIEAIKEQQSQIEDLKKQIQYLVENR